MRLIIGIVLFLFSPSVWAQDSCSGIIAMSRLQAANASSASEVQSHASNFCNEYRSSKGSSSSTNFGASYKFLSASFGTSGASVEEVASRYCSAANDFAARADAYSSYVETIAPGAYDAYKSCIEMGNAMSFKALGILPQQFTLAVSFNEAGASTAELRATPSEGVRCTWNGKAVPTVRLNSPATATLSCNRSKTDKPSFVTVARENGSQRIGLPWQGYTPEGVPIDLVARLRAELGDASARLATLAADVEAIQVSRGTINMASIGRRPLDDGSQCPANSDALRGMIDQTIRFPKPFVKVPEVMIGFNQLDVYNTSNFRANVAVTGVTRESFTVSFYTWCDTRIAGASANWMAVAR